MRNFADRALAERIEADVIADLREFVTHARAEGTYPDAEALEIAGGVFGYLGPGCESNDGFAVGMFGEVTAEDVAEVEAFFARHDARLSAYLSPFAHPSALKHFGEAGWVVTGFEQVLVQELPAGPHPEPAEGVSVRIAAPDELPLWADLAARGFEENEPSQAAETLAWASSRRDGQTLFIGYLDGEPAGTGLVRISGTLAHLTADSTLPDRRGRGVQQAVMAARLRFASEAGCDLAYIEGTAGGTSARNMERLGFRVVYTWVKLGKPT